jgi:N-acetylglucosaminyldiphosphoundecaprenol N-acetyl-beta-D-mannosaminyltransferase
MDKVNVLGINVARLTTSDLTDQIRLHGKDGTKRVMAYVNVHALNLAQNNDRFRSFLNGADVAYCDGEGVRLGARILGRSLPPRTVLTYWIWDICALCQEQNMSIFLLSGPAPTVDEAARKLRVRFPSLRVAGWHHGFFNRSGEENEEVIRSINAARPDILFVGFGMPAQERWIEENIGRLNVKMIFPSGSMVEYVAGRRHVAPEWMANHGMEWLFRLGQEPVRLWKRYVIGNPLFLLRVIGQRMREGSQR